MASLAGVWCFECTCREGVSLVWNRAIKHTHIEVLARGKCHRGGSHSARKSFPLSFYLSSLPFYIIEKATQQGTLGGCPPSSEGGCGGLMRCWRIPTERRRKEILIKTSSVSSLHFIILFFVLSSPGCFWQDSSAPWSVAALTLSAVKVKQRDVIEMQRQSWMNICSVAARPGRYPTVALASGEDAGFFSFTQKPRYLLN